MCPIKRYIIVPSSFGHGDEAKEMHIWLEQTEMNEEKESTLLGLSLKKGGDVTKGNITTDSLVIRLKLERCRKCKRK